MVNKLKLIRIVTVYYWPEQELTSYRIWIGNRKHLNVFSFRKTKDFSKIMNSICNWILSMLFLKDVFHSRSIMSYCHAFYIRKKLQCRIISSSIMYSFCFDCIKIQTQKFAKFYVTLFTSKRVSEIFKVSIIQLTYYQSCFHYKN